MLDNIINKNIMFLQKHGVKMNNSEGGTAIYKYGLQILYYSVIDLLVIFFLAFCFGKVYETAAIMFIFALFQVSGGGYHAKTALKCLLAMVAGAAAGNILIMLAAGHFMFNIVLAVICSVLIFFLTPVANKRHPVSKKVRRRSKIIIRIMLILVLTAMGILTYFNKPLESAAIAVTLGIYLVSLTAAKVKSR